MTTNETAANDTAKPKISRIKRSAPTPQKPTVSQLPIAIGLLILLALAGGYLAYVLNAPKLAFVWIIGILLGLTLQRSRFCFTASMRDPLLTGGTSLTKAVVIGLAVGTAGFAALQLGAYFKAGDLAAAMKVGSVAPVGLHTLVGGFLFGIGAVLAGGCASGTLMRLGEGFIQQMVALPFFILGSVLGAATWPLWKVALFVNMENRVYLPQLLGGFVPALIVQFGLLFAVWLLADWWSKRKTGGSL